MKTFISYKLCCRSFLLNTCEAIDPEGQMRLWEEWCKDYNFGPESGFLACVGDTCFEDFWEMVDMFLGLLMLYLVVIIAGAGWRWVREWWKMRYRRELPVYVPASNTFSNYHPPCVPISPKLSPYSVYSSTIKFHS
ncbi:unnamed protein product [Moneuplotes crassus]|uniref:Uncharacterized protein n=1 Tax=Euplotes crassus TaxID=5936 RepID=A0AAD1Y2J9_EUPCR|nr:unnamed protein product [Moneuplotes crassus]